MSIETAQGQAYDFRVRRRNAAAIRSVGADSRARRYTGEEILEAIRRWAHQYGEPPKMIDWEPARARRVGQGWRADRFQAGRWPSTRMVLGEFGSFNGAVLRAGLLPNPAPSRTRPNLADRDAIVEAITEWVRRYGDVPAMADWDPVRARSLGQDWRIARYQQGDWPSARSVVGHFGSFAAAVAAAGLVPRRRSVSRTERQMTRAENRRALAEARAFEIGQPGIQDLAEALRSLATARTANDPERIHAALIEVAASALAWAGVAGLGA